MIRISLVVPAYNEETYLPVLLDSVEEARERFLFGPSSIEVIIADNGSTDNTAMIDFLFVWRSFSFSGRGRLRWRPDQYPEE